MWYELADDTLRWERERILEEMIMGATYNVADNGKYRNYRFAEKRGPRRYWDLTWGVREGLDLDFEDETGRARVWAWELGG